MRITFLKDAGGYRKNITLDIEDITARVLIHRGYAKKAGEPTPPPVTETSAAPKAAAAPRAPRAAAPKKPAAAKKGVTKAPANRAMTAKKATSAPRSAPKKNEYETKDLHAKDADE